MLVLIAAAVVSLILGDYKDAIAILLIVVLNAVLGFRQEYRAEKSMAALKELAVPIVRVRRGGRVSELSARDLGAGRRHPTGGGQPGAGRRAADSSANLRMEEAALTGESVPVEKDAKSGLRRGYGRGRPAQHGLYGHDGFVWAWRRRRDRTRE